MRSLYTLTIRIYYFSILIASLFSKKAKSWIAGRKNIFNEIGAKIKGEGALIWIHCASLGEFEQGRPLIEKFKSQNSKVKILLTFFSPSGYEVRKNYELADHVFYLPLDTPANAEKFIQLIKPTAAIFIKYEFWYNYLNELKSRNIPLYLVSGVFRMDQVFFGLTGAWFRKQLNAFTHFFVQDEHSEKLLTGIGFKNVSVSGDTRFDRVSEIAKEVKSFPIVEKFKGNSKIFIVGSSWEEDEKIIKDSGLGIKDLKLIIAPHEINEKHISSIEERFSAKGGPASGWKELKTIRYSKATVENVSEANVLIIDNIGMLASLYRYGEIAYVGGGFGDGIHSILEAAVYGIPVIFGPRYEKFNEARELIEQGGGFCVNDSNELKNTLSFLHNDPLILKMASMISKNYVVSKTGATEKVYEVISEKMKK